MPSADQLKGMGQLPPKDLEVHPVKDVELPVPMEDVSVKESNKSSMISNGQHNPSTQFSSKQYLAASGLPTIPNKLAQRIWELEFIEMEEFLPTNKAIQALELAGTTEGEVRGVFHQLQQQARRVTDLITWVRCFTLYIAVMSQKRPELVAPMTAHLHMVIKLHGRGGLDWFHYDWKARRETCAMGPAEWGRCDPRQLLCSSGGGVMEDPFDPLPEGVPAGSGVGTPAVTPVKTRQPSFQPRSSAGSARKQGGVCRLFNRAPAGCSYGDQCIFVHRCTICRRTDHGRRNCPEEGRSTGP